KPAPTAAPAAAKATEVVKPAEPTKVAPSTAKQVTLSVLDIAVQPELAEQKKDMFARFTSDTGIQVDLEEAPYPAINDKFAAIMSSGAAPPDVAWANTDVFVNWAARGWTTPVD